MKNNKIYLALLITVILALAFFLRVYQLSSKPIWYDEAVSIAHAEKPLNFYILSPRVNYKPVYFILLKIWLHFFGAGSFALRFFSLIWGVLSVGLLYKLAKALFGTRVGLYSAFLLSISVFHIYHSQQVRHFSLIVFAVIASTYFLIRFIKKGKVYWLVLNTIANVLIVNIHPYGFCVWFFQIIFSVFCLPKSLLRKWYYAQGILFIVALAWLVLPNKDHIMALIWWIKRPSIVSLVETFATFSWGGPRYGLADFWIKMNSLILMNLLSGIYLILIIHGFLKNVNNSQKRKRLLLVGLWLAVPISASFLLSIISGKSVYSIKHLIIALPAFYIIVARGLDSINKNFQYITLFLIGIISIFPLKIMYSKNFCTDWQKSTEFVKKSIKDNEVIVVSTLAEVVPFTYYFNEDKISLRDMDIYGRIENNKCKSVFLADVQRNILFVGLAEKGLGGKNINARDIFKRDVLENTDVKDKNIWIMLSRWTNPEDKKAFLAYLEKSYLKIQSKEHQGVEIFYFSPIR